MVNFHSLFTISKSGNNKKAMGDRPACRQTGMPPMAFILNSIVYDSAGQTSVSFFSQHHRLLILNLKIFPT
jgi:hypothetical protein